MKSTNIIGLIYHNEDTFATIFLSPFYGGDCVRECKIHWLEVSDYLQQGVKRYSNKYFVDLVAFGMSDFLPTFPVTDDDKEILQKIKLLSN